MKVSECKDYLKVGMEVKTNGSGKTIRNSGLNIEGEIGEITSTMFYIWQDTATGSAGSISPSSKGYRYSWAVNFSNTEAEIEIFNSKGGKVSTTKKKKTKVKKKTSILETLVIPAETKRLVLETVSQAKEQTHNLIFKTWGFGDSLEKGKGAIILLWGPPGCGKTMCAEGIAEMLGKNFLMLGSGDFQSSIPGQTERNVKKAFVDAKSKDLLLIFDEADSVVYDRAQVGAILSAEINALLTEIERFEGVCILTTNRSENLDPALERRISLKLEFGPPNKISRKRIWRNLIPKKAPLHSSVCFDKLSKYELTGGQIKNAILVAARKAAALKVRGKKQIKHEHFVEGVRTELMGKKAWAGKNNYRFAGSGMSQTSKGTDATRRIGKVSSEDTSGGW